METFWLCLATGVVAVAWSAWRLKGGLSVPRAVLVVLGGPRPTTPK